VIIADTGFWVALANDRDKYHGLAADTIDNIRSYAVGVSAS